MKFGISFNFTAFNQAGALVHVYKDGSVLINHGGTEMGQGLHTKMLQVAATALGLPLERVRLAPTRTDKVPNTSATAASSGADLNGGAVKDACEQILEPARRGRRRPRPAVGGPGPRGLLQPGPAVGGRLLPHRGPALGLHGDAGPPFKYFAYGVAAAEVEVDGFTGAYRTRRVDIVHDVGDCLSPLVDLGQVEGGFVQGAGWLTLEDLRWDESDGPGRGRLTTQAASTYKLPSLSEMPERASRRAPRARPRGRRGLRLEGGRRAAADAGVRRARGAAAGGRGVRAARDQRRPRVAGDPGGGLLGAIEQARAGRTSRRQPRRHRRPARAGARPADAGAEPLHPRSEQRRSTAEVPDCTGCAPSSAAPRTPAGVLVTVADVRGHAPRDAGAKMVVAADAAWGSIGGGNLEETAIARARALLDARRRRRPRR